MPAPLVVESYVGGSAVARQAGDAQWLVAPEHGRPEFAVSPIAWRAVYWRWRLWPLYVLAPGLLGLFLVEVATGPGRRPKSVRPSSEPPRYHFASSAAIVAATAAGVWAAWTATGAPWVVWLVGYVVSSGGCIVFVLLEGAHRGPATDTESGAPPDRGG